MDLYHLSWCEAGFASKLKLFFSETWKQHKRTFTLHTQTRVSAYSSLSSTYYGIAGTGFAAYRSAKGNPADLVFWGLMWLPLSAYCFVMMRLYSRFAVWAAGLNNLTPDQCDVRQSILRKWLAYHAAARVIREGLQKPCAPHTWGLLNVAYAEVARKLRYPSHDPSLSINHALIAAKECEEKCPQQAVRIYRQCGVLKGDRDLLEKAHFLALKHGLDDQLLKL